jgi:hypothetical protein
MQNLVTDLCFRLTLQILGRQSHRIIIRIQSNTTVIYSSVIPKKIRPLISSSGRTRIKERVYTSSGNICAYDFILVQPEGGSLGRNMLLK